MFAYTYDTMYDSVLSKQDDLAWSTDKPFPAVLRACCTSFAEGEFLHRPTDGVGNPDIVVRREGNRASLDEGMTEIVQQIRRVLDSYTQTDQILRKTASSPGGRVDRGVPGTSGRQRQRVRDQTNDRWRGF